ncbi:hypothetical protein F0562_034225 [Nyssa sinensis]|uniref:Conserved oligomeric Golgi complex subunit 5 N-terminal domain-containing protein n=1 Tax=Nyssa sinensis TaxID=561372 RepID=A0A5J5AF27_9ASTE|nr:hypothetical protein F0562_034225 [Nyssa sinensis]
MVIIVINRAPIIPSNRARAATLAIFFNRAPILGAVSSIIIYGALALAPALAQAPAPASSPGAPVVLGFASSLWMEVAKSCVAAARAEKLQDDICFLEKQLRSEVFSRHHDLLSQLSSLKDVDSALAALQFAVSNLQSSVRRVHFEIFQRYGLKKLWKWVLKK